MVEGGVIFFWIELEIVLSGLFIETALPCKEEVDFSGEVWVVDVDKGLSEGLICISLLRIAYLSFLKVQEIFCKEKKENSSRSCVT